MYRYEIKYTNPKGKEIKVIRWAENAMDALQAYAGQYRLGSKITVIDGETHGYMSCEGYFCEGFNGTNPQTFVEVYVKGHEA